MVDADGVQELPGDLLAAGLDRLDGRAPDQVGQAPDHSPGALVEVALESGQGPGLVAAEAQGVFERGDQALPLIGERERQRGDEREPAGDLASPDAGEQALALQVDPRVDERGRDPFGEVLEGVGDFGAAAGGQLHVVDLIDQHHGHRRVDRDAADGLDDVGHVGSGRDRQPEEAGEFHGEHPGVAAGGRSRR